MTFDPMNSIKEDQEDVPPPLPSKSPPLTILKMDQPPETPSKEDNRISALSKVHLAHRSRHGKKSKKSEKICGCYQSRKTCWISSILILIFVFVALGLILFFCWPRIPIVTVGNIRQESGNGLGFNQTGDPVQALRQASMAAPFGAFTSFLLPVTITSSNYITYVFEKVTLDLHIRDRNGYNLQTLSGTGKVTQLKIPGRETTNLNLPIMFTFYTVKPITSISDNADLASLVTVCNSTSSQVSMAYSVQLTLESLSWLGIRPIVQGTSQMGCPGSLVRLVQIVRAATA